MSGDLWAPRNALSYQAAFNAARQEKIHEHEAVVLEVLNTPEGQALAARLTGGPAEVDPTFEISEKDRGFWKAVYSSLQNDGPA